MKKVLLTLLAITICISMVGAFSLAGCKPKPAVEEEAALPKEEITLDIWWWSEGDVPGSRDFLEQAKKIYEERNPTIKIAYVEYTDVDLYPAFIAAAEAKKGPDIQFLFSGSWLLPFVWKGYLDPMEEYFSSDEISNWLGRDAYTYQDKTWACPWYQMSISMLYNKSLFSKVGLDPENPPKTWDDYIAMGEKFKEEGVALFGWGAKDLWSNAQLTETLLPGECDNVNQFKVMALEKGGFDTPEIERFLNRIKTLSKYMNENVMSLDYGQLRDEFVRGNAATTYGNSSANLLIMKDMGDIVGVMRQPSYGDGAFSGKTSTQTQLFAIPSFAQDKQEAANFLRFLHEDEILKLYYDATGCFPATNKFNPDYLKTPLEKFLYELSIKEACPYPDLYMPPLVGDEGIYPALQGIISGIMNVQDAIKYIEGAAEKERNINPDEVENFKKWVE